MAASVAHEPTWSWQPYEGSTNHDVCCQFHVGFVVHHGCQATFTNIMFVDFHVGCDQHDVGGYMM